MKSETLKTVSKVLFKYKLLFVGGAVRGHRHQLMICFLMGEASLLSVFL